MVDTSYIRNLQLWLHSTNAAIVSCSVLALVFGWRLSRAKDKRRTKKVQTAHEVSMYLAQGCVILCTILALAFGSMLGTAKDRQSDWKMKTADLEIGEARRDVANARKETVKLRQGNIKLRIDLEAASVDAKSKQSELTAKQQKLAKAHQSLAEAEQKRAEAQLALAKTLEEVRRRQMPRTLTRVQRTRLIETLRSGPRGVVAVECVMGDLEGYAFARELAGVFLATGWAIENNRIVNRQFRGANPRGTNIVVRNPKACPMHAMALQQAFAHIKFPLSGMEDPELPEGRVVLQIGLKAQ